MNNAVFDVAALINAAQLRALSSGVPHYILIHWEPPPAGNPNQRWTRIRLLERPDEPGPGGVPIDWNALDLTNGPEVALAFQPTGAPTPTNAFLRGSVVLGVGSGPDRTGLSFMDLNSNRVRGLVRPPFTAVSLHTDTAASPLDSPSPDLMAGCNFCVNPSLSEPYGVLQFNADGTMQVMTGPPSARSGAAIAFAPSTQNETGIVPKVLVVSAPAGSTVVF
jgi:hypothetical protein